MDMLMRNNGLGSEWSANRKQSANISKDPGCCGGQDSQERLSRESYFNSRIQMLR
jgi:hypothetical protein